MHSISVNKSLRTYHLQHRKHKKSLWVRSGFHLEKSAKSYTNRNKSNISKKYTFLPSTPLNKIVSEWSIYHIETIKIILGGGLNFTSKN